MARPLRIDVEDGLDHVTSRRHGNDGRLAAIYLARRVTDEAVGAIGECFGGVSAAAISKTVARVESRLREDPDWARRLEKLASRLTTCDDAAAKKLNVKT